MNLAAGCRVCAAPGRGLDRLDITRTATTDRITMTPRVNFSAADTSYGGFILLKEDRYKSVHGAEMPDDGIVDDVAVSRRVAGQAARITPREVVCVVAESARRGLTDPEIAALLGRDTIKGGEWVQGLRRRNRIDAGMPLNDGDALADRLGRIRAAA